MLERGQDFNKTIDKYTMQQTQDGWLVVNEGFAAEKFKLNYGASKQFAFGDQIKHSGDGFRIGYRLKNYLIILINLL